MMLNVSRYLSIASILPPVAATGAHWNFFDRFDIELPTGLFLVTAEYTNVTTNVCSRFALVVF